jgi:protein-tyrosine-phosphatase
VPVLVLDGDTPAALAVVRSLGRRGHRVEVASSAHRAVASLSRYCERDFSYPDPLRDARGFEAALVGRLTRRPYALVIPATAATIRPLMRIRDAVEARAPLAMSSNDSLATALSRSRTHELARALSIPVVPTLEEPLPGDGVGLAVVAVRGEVRCMFQHRRLHEVPPSGGAGSYWISEPLDPDLVEYASVLLKDLKWDGVAEVQFRVDRAAARSYLVGLEGHFTRSLPLAVAAGADLPAYLVDLAADRRRDVPRAYRAGVRCRDLARDLEWLRAAVTGRGRPRGRTIVWEALRMLNPAEQPDTLDVRDPWPGAERLRVLARRMLDRGRDAVGRARERRRTRRLRRRPHAVLQALRRARSILIVCHGNVIRSGFAAGCLAAATRGRAPVATGSAGLEAAPGDPAHPSAVAKARELDVDLSGHRATRLTREIATAADVVFVMELSQLVLVRRRFPGTHRKTFLLSCLAPDVPLEILDPIGREPAAFDACFDHIVRSLRPIVRAICGDGAGAGGRP